MDARSLKYYINNSRYVLCNDSFPNRPSHIAPCLPLGHAFLLPLHRGQAATPARFRGARVLHRWAGAGGWLGKGLVDSVLKPLRSIRVDRMGCMHKIRRTPPAPERASSAPCQSRLPNLLCSLELVASDSLLCDGLLGELVRHPAQGGEAGAQDATPALGRGGRLPRRVRGTSESGRCWVS